MSNPISLEDYQRLVNIAEEIKQMRDKYNLMEIQIEDKKWYTKETLNISVRVRKPLDCFSSYLIINNEINEEYSSYEKFITR